MIPFDYQTPQDPQPRIQELDEQQCWELLSQARFARLGTLDEGQIDITPLNIATDGQKIYFRTAKGHKLTQLTLNPTVAVEVDRAEGGTAVSVLVRGQARQLTDPEEIQHVESLALNPWLNTEKLEFVEITPTRVTGRRFRLGQ